MGCGVSKSSQFNLQKSERAATVMRAAVRIQRWYRQHMARMEMRRRCIWNIFQSIEYAEEQDQIKLYNFLGYLEDHFTPSSRERNLISHIFRENEKCCDPEWEKYFCYKNIEVPDVYSGPHLTFPLTVPQATNLVEAFRNKQQLHSRYVLQLLLETWKLLRILPNINWVSTYHSKEISICGDLHGQLEDLLFIFYKNGMPSMEKPYVFNGDFVDRGKDSVEILLILFAFLLVYPSDVHLNRGNHEDHIVNLRYGFTKEVLGKYRVHGKRILKLLQMIFSWLPLATVIDHKVLILHGGISDTTDLSLIAKMDRHRYVSALRPAKRKKPIPERRLSMHSDWLSKVSKCSQRRASMAYANPFGSRNDFHWRSLQDFSRHVMRPVEDELEECRRKARGSVSIHDLFHPSSEDSSLDVCHPNEVSDEEWKQIVDLLWSDPMSREGCIPNEVRGGGCYWGPDVTEQVLSKHHLQLLIRSHECKQEGYEFCHDRKVLTLFSASNYYEVGSNRGAYVTLGPDLAPHLVQYRASNTTWELTLKQRVGWTENSALKVLREQLFAHRPDLIRAFQEFDKENTGWISVNDWACAVEAVLQLGVPWRVLRSQLVPNTSDGKIDYQDWFRELAVKEPDTESRRQWLAVNLTELVSFFHKHIHQALLDMVYRHRSTLETIFRIVDTDHSGLISLEDFHQTWKLLSAYLNMEISDEAISKLAISIDDNEDGSIDINEFMEAFRLVDKSRLENEHGLHRRTTEKLSEQQTSANPMSKRVMSNHPLTSQTVSAQLIFDEPVSTQLGSAQSMSDPSMSTQPESVQSVSTLPDSVQLTSDQSLSTRLQYVQSMSDQQVSANLVPEQPISEKPVSNQQLSD